MWTIIHIMRMDYALIYWAITTVGSIGYLFKWVLNPSQSQIYMATWVCMNGLIIVAFHKDI